MKPSQARELQIRFRQHHSLVTRAELRLLGVTYGQERSRVQAGEWEVAAPGVLRLAGSVRTPEQALLAACLGAGSSGVASHQSAAWMWDLLERAPDRHAVTVARGVSGRVAGVDIHRPVDYPSHVVTVRAVPCTDPLRSLVDLAAVSDERTVDDAIDRAVARKLVTFEAVAAEVARLSRHGRGGVGRTRAALRRRGLTGVPYPSVLESRTLRLLRRHRIVPLACEVRVGPEGRYRIDILLAPKVAMEVDGFTHHSDPEQVAEDKRRRTRIRLDGMVLLEYTWQDIMRDPRRVIREVQEALSTARSRSSADKVTL